MNTVTFDGIPGSSEETYEQHLSETSAHWQKMDELTRYRSVYMESLHPLLAEENIIRAQLKASEQQAEANGTLARSHDLGLDLQRLEHVLSRLGRLTRDIEARCAWNEAEQLQTEIATFRKTLLLVQSIISQGMYIYWLEAFCSWSSHGTKCAIPERKGMCQTPI